jgi:hypothetical protein
MQVLAEDYKSLIEDFLRRYYSDKREHKITREIYTLQTRLEAVLRRTSDFSYESIRLALLDSGYAFSCHKTKYTWMILAILSPELDPIAYDIIKFVEKVKRASLREIMKSLGLFGDIRIYVYRALVIDKRLKVAGSQNKRNMYVYI